MQSITAHKIALDPNKRQITLLRQHCGAARVAYNHALADFKAGLEINEWRGEYDLRKRFDAVKYDAYPWIATISSRATGGAISDLGKAIKRWGAYRKSKADGKPGAFVGFPKFRSVKRGGYRYHAAQSFGLARTDGRKVRLPRIGWIRMREYPRFDGQPRSATISETAGRWFVTLTYAIADNPPVAPGYSLGIDMGLTTLATLSDGITYESPKALKAELSRLRHLNKRMARQVKGSNRRARTRLALARCHARIANIRRDHAHKATSAIVKRKGLGVIGVETLNIKGLMRNRRLSRAFADAGISEWLRMLEYKCARNGIAFVKADRWFPSSRLCNACGWHNAELTMSMRQWTCGGCGARLSRDLNAAKNLGDDAAGQAVNGRRDGISPPNMAAIVDEASTRQLSLFSISPGQT